MAQHLASASADHRNPIDIEAFLIWVYRDQKADIVVGQGQGMHAIEAALDGVPCFGVSACGAAAVARIGELGWRVDGGGFSAGALHIDAELAHEAVIGGDRALAHLIIRHARTATRPEILTRRNLVARPVPNGRGQPTIQYEPWDKRRNYGTCRVQWAGSMARIEASVLEFRLWARALKMLAMQLQMEARLTAHRVYVSKDIDITHLP